MGNLSRFLDLAASQSGRLVSFTTIGRECRVAPRTVQSHDEILEDTLIAFRLNPRRSEDVQVLPWTTYLEELPGIP